MHFEEFSSYCASTLYQLWSHKSPHTNTGDALSLNDDISLGTMVPWQLTIDQGLVPQSAYCQPRWTNGNCRIQPGAKFTCTQSRASTISSVLSQSLLPVRGLDYYRRIEFYDPGLCWKEAMSTTNMVYPSTGARWDIFQVSFITFVDGDVPMSRYTGTSNAIHALFLTMS